ncbi:NAD(P)/FAD-dependent oxidoreductase [Rhizobium rhizogenes]|uniref:NAD(P)/FAD-dependent oxidoreductase n=1 Tax=Rhizobium rhizogenes TaxID=359 RepID=UPI001574EE25|nr:FAD-binding oxidoreductase [Rhizobium rhizogenes]NTF69228.1 FAD-binding oxidoreductase [Rhizobium rhizogenes]NTG01559.1 FAD-binding oxidoreductase [Rhizobium rhizogenes]NTG42254.1 FAD-binding oxidoreductase [Rhizobium rhizogenes]NTH46502.1 FAD-binding oxidoreductase [Rhizobium rhizogenes]NTH59368.1 FAD-binding oxidoreductase [Rhizobium rhizogenes]
MPSSQKIIVVGAGIIGASIAWHLQRKGADVTVIAKKAGGEATPNSFAWINASWGNPEFYYRFRRRSMAEWARLATDIPGLPLSWCGGLCWDMPEAELEAYLAQHHGWGYDIQPVTRATSATIEPNLIDPPTFAVHVAEEGAVEPVAAANLLLEDAARHGATLSYGAEVSRLLQENGKITGVETTDGVLLADHVVLAAGADTRPLAAAMGIDVPIETPPGLIAHSRPHPRLLNGLVMAPELHMRQTQEGRIIAGSDFGGGDPGDDPRKAAEAILAKVRAMLRGGEQLELDFYTIGYRPNPKDGFPIIGGVDGVPGLHLAVLHSGVTLAPLVGLLAAEEIVGGHPDAQLAPFRLSRFAKAGE